MQTALYREYRIQTMSYQDFQSRRWIPKATVVPPRGGGAREATQLTSETRRFQTRQESDNHALTMAKVWIDRQA